MIRRSFVAVAVTSALVLAACGGDDDSGTPATTAAPDTTVAPEEPADTTAPEEPTDTTAPEEPTDTTEPAVTTEPEAPADDRWVADTSVCESPAEADAVIEGEILIGSSIPLSGGPAVLFAPFAAGFSAYFDYYNAQFGGVNDQPLRAIVKDDQYDSALTRAAVDELLFDEGVHLLSGIIGSANNAAILEDMTAQCIPQLWVATGASNWGGVDTTPWVSGLLIPYPIEIEAFLTFASEQLPDGGTAALFYVNNEFGQAYAESLNARAGEFGFTVVAEETIDFTDSGAPTGQMTNLVAANPDIIIAVPLGAQCIAFMSELGNAQAANSDFDPLVYQTATCANPIFFGAVGNGGNDGVYTSANLKDVNNADVQANDADVQAYLDAFAATGSTADPGGIAVAGWHAAELTVYVIQQAADTGTLSRATIIEAVRNIDYEPTLIREGLRYVMGPDDGFGPEGAQIQQWSVAEGGFIDAGELYDFEGFLGVYGR